MLHIGLDIGSTTIKIIILDDKGIIKYKKYERHLSNVRDGMTKTIVELIKIIDKKTMVTLTVTGSNGIGFAENNNLDYVQEVIACSMAIKKYKPDTSIAIELGGEDAKLMYLGDNYEYRMNTVCAGGTGAFIDQMTELLNVDHLNDIAKKGDTVHSIASRCGVFAKSDIQVLLSQGVSKGDIALSIYEAIAKQTITGLARGREISGKVILLGGPFYYSSELRERFIQMLENDKTKLEMPENSQYYVAIGAAINSMNNESSFELIKLYEMMTGGDISSENEKTNKLEPLFINMNEYNKFKERHNKYKISRADIKNYNDDIYLGIDAGSTTLKIVLLDKNANMLYSNYQKNDGEVLEMTKNALLKMYEEIGKKKIVYAVVIGYGEDILKSAFKVDDGEVETMAHYKAAKYFVPNATSILDIGGQDMKFFKIINNSIDSIILNEACSAGCGSFIQTLANTLNISIDQFVQNGLYAKQPINLGTKCTIFMNSRIKQAQKEGAKIEDIAAGLSISIIKNALFKVIKLNDVDELGENIVVQGGSFYNDCILRAFEMISQRNVIRPEIAGLMGAFGAALIAIDRNKKIKKNKSSILNANELLEFKYVVEYDRCDKCPNNCLLTINKFGENKTFISGNKCDRGVIKFKKNDDNDQQKKNIPNAYKYQYERVFNYKPLQLKQATRGKIGIPRVLNMYNDYPFWFTFLTYLKFRVILSSSSNKEMHEQAINTIVSDTVCFPAKVVHGHIYDLIKRKIEYIFYPNILYCKSEDKNSTNTYNCPVVGSYPELIRDAFKLHDSSTKLISPILDLNSKKKTIKILSKVFHEIDEKEIIEAYAEAEIAQDKYYQDVQKHGDETLSYIKKTNIQGLVLIGKPYHIDPFVNHSVDELIIQNNCAVLSELSICHLGIIHRPLKIYDQWRDSTRQLAATSYASYVDNLNVIHLNSFGCGIDSLLVSEIKRILKDQKRIYTSIRLDDIENVGGMKLRIRTMLTISLDHDDKSKMKQSLMSPPQMILKENTSYDTLLIPSGFNYHTRIMSNLLKQIYGYKIIFIDNIINQEVIDYGLKYVHNDMCYPAILITGQIIATLKKIHNTIDLNKTRIFFFQSCGGCRYTNYVQVIKNSTKNAGFDINVVTFSSNTNIDLDNDFFQFGKFNQIKMLLAIIYADLLVLLVHQTRPYEKIPDSTNKLTEKYLHIIGNDNILDYDIIQKMIKEFGSLIALDKKKQTRIAILGEVYLNSNDAAIYNLPSMIEKKGLEVIRTPLITFIINFLISNYFIVPEFHQNNYSVSNKMNYKIIIKSLDHVINYINTHLQTNNYISYLHSSQTLIEPMIAHKLSFACQYGESWTQIAESICLIKQNVKHIIYVQPFGCLPSHMLSRGTYQLLKNIDQNVNILNLDYDPNINDINIINRLNLFVNGLVNKRQSINIGYSEKNIPTNENIYKCDKGLECNCNIKEKFTNTFPIYNNKKNNNIYENIFEGINKKYNNDNINGDILYMENIFNDVDRTYNDKMNDDILRMENIFDIKNKLKDGSFGTHLINNNQINVNDLYNKEHDNVLDMENIPCDKFKCNTCPGYLNCCSTLFTDNYHNSA